jgi:CDP-4-dehydro-6-deoxyglucose reductase
VGEVMRYWPGQYVTLGDERSGAPPRCYSIANAPRADGEIALLVTRVADGRTSCWAHDVLRDGDVVDVSGPYGTFVGDPLVASPVLCMASGSGLAPILALNEAALLRGYRNPVTMMFSARTSADLFDEGLMRYWETRHRNFSWKPTLTRETREGFLSGRIPAVLPQVFSDLSKHRIFIAGNPDFVVACAAAAKALGAREDMTYTEGYFAQAQPQTAPASHLVSG